MSAHHRLDLTVILHESTISPSHLYTYQHWSSASLCVAMSCFSAPHFLSVCRSLTLLFALVQCANTVLHLLSYKKHSFILFCSHASFTHDAVDSEMFKQVASDPALLPFAKSSPAVLSAYSFGASLHDTGKS